MRSSCIVRPPFREGFRVYGRCAMTPDIIKALRDALAFYADPENYHRPALKDGFGLSPVVLDGGSKAIEALAAFDNAPATGEPTSRPRQVQSKVSRRRANRGPHAS